MIRREKALYNRLSELHQQALTEYEKACSDFSYGKIGRPLVWSEESELDWKRGRKDGLYDALRLVAEELSDEYEDGGFLGSDFIG